MNLISACDCICMVKLLTVCCGMYMHIYQLSLVGINSQMTEYLNPGFSSALFCFALCWLSTEFNYWPFGFKEPHALFLVLYQVILSCFFVDVGMRSLYVSAQSFYHWLFDYLCIQAASTNFESLTTLATFIKNHDTAELFSCLMSIITFMLVMYSTGHMDCITAYGNWSVLKGVPKLQQKSIVGIDSAILVDCLMEDEESKTFVTRTPKSKNKNKKSYAT